MTVSILKAQRLALPWVPGGLIAVAGLVSLFATYWDDAWHTDIGRDDATIPPHLLLYGAVAVAGVAVACWGLFVVARNRSIGAALRHGPLMLAGVGGASTLVAAPVDAAWHAAYGRDAVLWSPPHMLVVLASTAMITGVLTGLRRSPGRLVEAAVAVALIGTTVASVLEFETDVPQFSEVWYLPVLLAAALFAAALARTLVPSRAPVAAMVGGYVLFRLLVSGVLLVLGRTAPDLPVAMLGLLLVDLPWRRPMQRYAAGAAGVSALAWVAAVTGLASQPPAQVAVVAVPVVLASVLIIVGTSGRAGPAAVVGLVGLVGAGAVLAPARPAAAHDPGQGEHVTTARMTAISDGDGRLTLAVEPTDCTGLSGMRLVARRAGLTVAAPVQRGETCLYEGTLQVPGGGRWFTYLEARHGADEVETWLPIEADRTGTTSETRSVYRPAGAGAIRPAQVGAGVLIYAAGVLLLALALRETHRAAGTRRSVAAPE